MTQTATSNSANSTSSDGKTSYLTSLITPVPDTDLRDFLEETSNLLRFSPEILEKIDQDLDQRALKKKRLRQEDHEFFQSQTADLPDLDLPKNQRDPSALTLETGRPRMTATAVYLFMMLRGFLGSLTSKPARRMILESMSLEDFLQRHGLKRPGETTMLENVNAISTATRSFIMDRQIELILQEKLDDFQEITIDSTAVKANSSWPTDGKMLNGHLTRAHRLGQQLHLFGLKDFAQGWLPRWLKEMEALEFQINLTAGKPKSRGKIKKRYRQLLGRGEKAKAALTRELDKLNNDLDLNTLAPSRRAMCARLIEQITSDIASAEKIIQYTADRIMRDAQLPSTEKILSLSDGSAAYIKKGGREAVIGYKPQLVRSSQGFVTSLIVPEGNAADSIKLAPAIRESIERTGVIAQLVSTDDGYASAKGRNALLEMGVKDVSISGAKGKKITEIEDWESETYSEARRNRSAVESLMFTLKDGFSFGELGRRGIEAVRQELSEKVLAYNTCRTIMVRQRRNQEREKQKNKPIKKIA